MPGFDLLELALSTCYSATSPNVDAYHPLSRDGLIDLAHKLCIQLQSPYLDDALSLQVVKNLFYIWQMFQSVAGVPRVVGGSLCQKC